MERKVYLHAASLVPQLFNFSRLILYCSFYSFKLGIHDMMKKKLRHTNRENKIFFSAFDCFVFYD
jgi:hypothetical protein